ncbi:hypothetical protein A4X13_0g417 [Tilletia indica]|uniref:Proteasome assembly chaperone 3 n=1 Tax=Tilletia indica TaxID=43049 RepID=A0A177TED9_9BASI|nr:hypothetical protein A4X13_0g417 [Tilletia indica]
MSRWGGRFAPNQENELRRLVKEPVQTWKREWVQPDPNKPFKVLKFVKTGQSIDFATQAALEADKAGEQDDEPEQVQEVEADEGDQEQEQDNDEEDRDEDDEDGDPAAGKVAEASVAAERIETAPASALPAHMQAEADAAAVAAAGTTASSSAESTTAATTGATTASSSSSLSSSASSPGPTSPAGAQIDTAALLNAAAGIPATAAAALSAPIATAAATGSESVGGGGVQVASELNPPPDGVQPAAAVAAPVTVTTLDDANVTTGEGGGGGDAVPTRQEVRSVAGVTTEVLIQAFTDRILVLVTQLGRVGCLIQATTATPAHYVPSSILASRRPLEEDDHDYNSDDPCGDVPVSAYLEPPTTKSGAVLPNPLPNTALLSLFGAPPAGQETLFSLYVSQIAAIVHARAGGSMPSDTRSPPGASREEPDPRPVVVGLALQRLRTASKEGEEQGFDGLDEADVLDEGERERFLEIMEMVLACRVW